MGGALSDRDVAVLEIAARTFTGPGPRERAIRERLGMSPTAYFQLLNALLDDPARRRPRPHHHQPPPRGAGGTQGAAVAAATGRWAGGAAPPRGRAARAGCRCASGRSRPCTRCGSLARGGLLSVWRAV